MENMTQLKMHLILNMIKIVTFRMEDMTMPAGRMEC